MIHTTLNFLAAYLTKEIEKRSAAGPKAVLASLPKEPDDNTDDKIFVTLYSIEEEKVLKSHAAYFPDAAHPNRIHLHNPEIRLNLWVLFTAQFKKEDYESALRFISQLVTIFQGKYVFEETDFTTAEKAAGLEKIVLELHSPNFDQNNQIWQTMGSKMVPFAIYKVRIVVMLDKEAPHVRSSELVQGIDLELKHK